MGTKGAGEGSKPKSVGTQWGKEEGPRSAWTLRGGKKKEHGVPQGKRPRGGLGQMVYAYARLPGLPPLQGSPCST